MNTKVMSGYGSAVTIKSKTPKATVKVVSNKGSKTVGLKESTTISFAA